MRFSVRSFVCALFYWKGDSCMNLNAAIIGAILSGAIIGAIPAVCGAVKQKIGLAIGGFFACLFASILLGMILSVPTCALFLFLIFRKPKSVPQDLTHTVEPPHDDSQS